LRRYRRRRHRSKSRSYSTAPQIVLSTDLAVILPHSIAEHFDRGLSLCLLALPYDLPSIDVQIYAHECFASDPGIAWLRAPFMDMFARALV
jgi:DNA-binding transcriptional LysR family regulator